MTSSFPAVAHFRACAPRSASMLLGLAVASCGYNTLPTLEEQAKARWGDVQNQYQRRADLIPNLVATVQGYAKQEKDVLTVGRRGARQGDADQDRRLAADRPREAEAVPGCAEPAVRRARPPDRGHRGLSGPQIQRELPRTAKPARGHREPHRRRAARLYRGRAANTTSRRAPSRRSSGRSSPAPSRWRIRRQRRCAETPDGEVLTPYRASSARATRAPPFRRVPLRSRRDAVGRAGLRGDHVARRSPAA